MDSKAWMSVCHGVHAAQTIAWIIVVCHLRTTNVHVSVQHAFDVYHITAIVNTPT